MMRQQTPKDDEAAGQCLNSAEERSTADEDEETSAKTVEDDLSTIAGDFARGSGEVVTGLRGLVAGLARSGLDVADRGLRGLRDQPSEEHLTRREAEDPIADADQPDDSREESADSS